LAIQVDAGREERKEKKDSRSFLREKKKWRSSVPRGPEKKEHLDFKHGEERSSHSVCFIRGLLREERTRKKKKKKEGRRYATRAQKAREQKRRPDVGAEKLFCFHDGAAQESRKRCNVEEERKKLFISLHVVAYGKGSSRQQVALS